MEGRRLDEIGKEGINGSEIAEWRGEKKRQERMNEDGWMVM